MNKVVAFGCSHTFGMGLKDCFLGEDQKFKAQTTPSKYSWPALLANRLKIECDNQSIPGGSNFEILQKVINYKFNETDIVVIGWTTPQRDMLKNQKEDIRIASYALQEEIKIDTLLLNNKESTVRQINKKYFDIHSDYDMQYKSWLYQYTAGLHLKSKNVTFNFSTVWGWKNINHPFDNFVSIENFIDKYRNNNKLTPALDGMHIGELTQKVHANAVFNKLKNIL